jgi:3-phenylpropionate/trans-cinnamate dioxygenase ferredoxin reductase subunit
MIHYDYLIIGGGVAAESAMRGIREVDASGSIGCVGAEPYAPYDRPPLSKALWKGEPEESIWRPPLPDGVGAHFGRRVTRIDRKAHEAIDSAGDRYKYRKLLLATGGVARRLGPERPRVLHYRTLDHYRQLRALLGDSAAAIVVGSGFIGCEMAAALNLAGQQVTLVSPEDGLGPRLFPPSLSRALVDFYRGKGVDVLTNDRVEAVSPGPVSVSMRTRSGRTIVAAAVVVGVGIKPAADLAAQAGLEVKDGVIVDAMLRTADPDIYAAGDVARFPSAVLGRPMRVEHEDGAKSMGVAAGRNMAGAGAPYAYLPMFYSDLFDVGYEAVGELDPRLDVVEDWKEFPREGVVYYLAAGRVRGVLLWNVWGQVDAARALIAEPGPFDARTLEGRLPA